MQKQIANTCLLLVVVALAMVGCVTPPPAKVDLCADYDVRMRTLRTATSYALVSPAPTRARNSASPRVTDFRIAPNLSSVPPCAVLMLNKELMLHTHLPDGVQLMEVREFYAANGALITTRTDRLHGQFSSAGQYKSATAVPIPPGAPPGKYRVLVRLTTSPIGNRKAVALATTETSFAIQTTR